MTPKSKEMIQYTSEHGFMPQEEMLESQKGGIQLNIGIPKDRANGERRVVLIPESVELLVRNGHRVMVEHNAGLGAFYTDHEYSEAGAEIKYDPREIYKADIILKVAAPNDEELEYIDSRKVLMSSLHWKDHNSVFYRSLLAKKLTAFAFEKIRDKNGVYPVIRSMSEIAGNTSILLAAEYLSSTKYGRGSIFGGFSGIAPTDVVVIGAGTVGEFATRSALGMGAHVKVFDNDVGRLRRIQETQNQRIYTSIIQPKRLAETIKTADVVIGALRPVEGMTPVVVSEEMVQNMKKGAIIIDVSIDHGGCFETSEPTTHERPVFQKYNVTHYCVPNMPSRAPRTASVSLSNFFAPILLSISENGGVDEVLKKDYGFRKGAYLYKGILTDKNIAKRFQLSFQDIDLLIAAFHK
ncbi:MAG: alanine dehydrogenase [Bacteroidales bacterium]|nr:alanine dehydrogenase [Bacteroidales bacterium]MCF8336614.1 alanine dehydrogenase [Bacteroidales bacterium]